MSRATTQTQRCTVLIPGPFTKAFDYFYESEVALKIGQIIKVPFGKRLIYGVVWPQSIDTRLLPHQIKWVHTISMLTLPHSLVEMIDWMSHYNLIPKGNLLKLVFGSIDPFSKIRKPLPQTISGLDHPSFHLSPEQNNAYEQILSFLKGTKPIVLDGVTGSGKTEVYMQIITNVLKQNKQVLILLPEIALTPDWKQRFVQKFGFECLIWHSQISTAQRKAMWHLLIQGGASVVVGARSSLFLPFQNLGLIVVDEEHDATFKQDDSPVYQARDMAILRAHKQKIPIILSSATPSLETYWNALQNKYEHVRLSRRYTKAPSPSITTCDLKTCTKLKNDQGIVISEEFINALKSNLANGGQSLLFLNRRGYSPLNLCSGCGNKKGCPQCSTFLVEHKKLHKLQCHQCGWSASKSTPCQSCGSVGSINIGVGVEKLADYIAKIFPHARLSVVSSDHLPSGPKLDLFLEQIRNHQVDIIIGTQILAKGHNFPHLTFVGIMDADAILTSGSGLDMRAAERTFQIIEQVSGRAGRFERPGHVMLQTYQPEHPVMKSLVLRNRDAFYNLEITQRKAACLPPFGKLIALIVSCPHQDKLKDFVYQMKQKISPHQEVKVFGPIPAPIEKIRTHYRWRFLFQSSKTFDLSYYVGNLVKDLKIPATLKLKVDVDPYNFS